MITLSVQTSSHTYPIYIGHNLLSKGELILPFIQNSKVMIITNNIIYGHFEKSLKLALNKKHIDILINPRG